MAAALFNRVLPGGLPQKIGRWRIVEHLRHGGSEPFYVSDPNQRADFSSIQDFTRTARTIGGHHRNAKRQGFS